VEANFGGLEILSRGPAAMDEKKLAFAMEFTQTMVTKYLELLRYIAAVHSDFKDEYQEEIGRLERAWGRVRSKIGRMSIEDIRMPEERKVVFQIRSEEDGYFSRGQFAFDTVETLHEMINCIHERSFSPIMHLAERNQWSKAGAERLYIDATEDGFGSREINLIDVGDIPAMQGAMITSPLLAALIEAFEENQPHDTEPTLFLQDDQLMGHISLGTHSASVVAKLADPDEGGMILVRYMEIDDEASNKRRLYFIKAVMDRLGMDTYVESDMYLTIRMDKDTGASNIHDISRALTAVMRVLLYSKGLDYLIQTDEEIEGLADMYMKDWSLTLDSFFQPDADVVFDDQTSYDRARDKRRVDYYPLEIDERLTDRFNKHLRQLGVHSQIPVELPLTQAVMDMYYNEPLERCIERGELYWDGNTLVRNNNFHPVEDFLDDVENNMVALRQTSELLAPLISTQKLDTIAAVGRYLLQVGIVRTAEGMSVLTAAYDPQSGNYIFARIMKKRKLEFIPYTLEDIRAFASSLGYDDTLDPIPLDEVKPYQRAMMEDWEEFPEGITCLYGKDAAAGDGLRTRAVITTDKEKAREEGGYILLVKLTTPEDVPAMAKSVGIVSTSGGRLSHASITSRELEIPSVILSCAREIQDEDGRPAWEVITYEPVDPATTGYRVARTLRQKRTRIQEGSEVIIDGTTGQLFVIQPEAQESNITEIEEGVGTIRGPPPEHEILPAREIIPSEVRSEPILSLEDLGAEDFRSTGPKGANLGELTRLVQKRIATLCRHWGVDVKVPQVFVVTLSAFLDFLRKTNIEDPDTGRVGTLYELIDSTIKNELLTPEERSLRIDKYLSFARKSEAGETLSRLIRRYMGEDGVALWWAVRSSSIGEDSADTAFAGLGITDLFVHRMKIFEYVVSNFSSFATPRALAYRAKKGLGVDISHAVVVQEMVDADVSGVIFTKNPVNDDTSEIVINASYGLGEAVVSGLVDPDEYVIDKRTSVTKGDKSTIGTKRIQIVPRGDGKPGVVTENVPWARRVRPALDRKWQAILAEVAREIEEWYGMRMDIEFAIKDDTLYILQARPITTTVRTPVSPKDSQRRTRTVTGIPQDTVWARQDIPEPTARVSQPTLATAAFPARVREDFIIKMSVEYDGGEVNIPRIWKGGPGVSEEAAISKVKGALERLQEDGVDFPVTEVLVTFNGPMAEIQVNPGTGAVQLKIHQMFFYATANVERKFDWLLRHEAAHLRGEMKAGASREEKMFEEALVFIEELRRQIDRGEIDGIIEDLRNIQQVAVKTYTANKSLGKSITQLMHLYDVTGSEGSVTYPVLAVVADLVGYADDQAFEDRLVRQALNLLPIGITEDSAKPELVTADDMENQVIGLSQILDKHAEGNMFDGAPCYIYIAGAIPVDTMGKEMAEASLQGLISKVKGASNDMMTELGHDNITISYFLDSLLIGDKDERFNQTKQMINKIIAHMVAGVDQARVAVIMSGQILDELSEDTELLGKVNAACDVLGKKQYVDLEEYLKDNVMLNVIVDEEVVVLPDGSQVAIIKPVPYGPATMQGFARLNAACVARKIPESRSEEDWRDPIRLLAATLGNLSNISAAEIEQILLSAMREEGERFNPETFFIKKTFEIMLPPIGRIDYSEIKKAFKTWAEVVRAL